MLAAAVSFGAPDPLMLAARADEEAGATAFEKRQAAVERRKEIMAKACAPAEMGETSCDAMQYG